MLPTLRRIIEKPLHRTDGNAANAVPLARIVAGLLYASQNEGARDDWPHLPTLLTCKESRGFECDPIARWLPFNIARQRKCETSPADARQQIQKAGRVAFLLRISDRSFRNSASYEAFCPMSLRTDRFTSGF